MSIRIVTALAACLLSACAIHPLPEDVTGVSTYHIVRQIRCETRESLRKLVIGWLQELADYGDPLSRRLVEQYENDPDAIRTFHYKIFSGPRYAKVRDVAKLFYDAAVAYNFDFDIAEQNNLTSGVDFLQTFAKGSFTLGFTGMANRKRANQRIFTVSDTFSHLLTKLPQKYCEGFIREANYIYPVVGRIGVDKVIKDFVNLTLFGALSGPADSPKGPPTLVDTVTFTTVFSLSANPVATFTPVTSALQLTSASGTGLLDRTDIHKVTIGLAIDTGEQKDVDPVREMLFSRSRSGVVVGRRVTGGGTASEQLAVKAIDQVKAREIRIVPAP